MLLSLSARQDLNPDRLDDPASLRPEYPCFKSRPAMIGPTRAMTIAPRKVDESDSRTGVLASLSHVEPMR